MLNKIRTLFSSPQTDAQKQITALYHSYEAKFIAFICKSFPAIEASTAKELYHDSFTTLYEHVQSGKLTELKSSLATYLFGIGKNKALKYDATQRKFQETHYPDVFPEITETDETDEWNKKQEIARQLVFEMKNPCKEILNLYYWQQKSMYEIAVAMNYKNEQIAKNRKSICLKTLKAALIEKFKKEGLN